MFQIEARAKPGHSLTSPYGRDWEIVCSNRHPDMEELDYDYMVQLSNDWAKTDPSTFYRVVPCTDAMAYADPFYEEPENDTVPGAMRQYFEEEE